MAAQVYLDAAFFPNLNRLDFLQEGWRLEHTDPTDTSTPLVFKGVVYNEMKGVFSSPDSVFYTQSQTELYPGTTYEHVSGGDPDAITDLSWEGLKAFHAKHYHPSNCRFYSSVCLSPPPSLACVLLSRVPLSSASSSLAIPLCFHPPCMSTCRAVFVSFCAGWNLLFSQTPTEGSRLRHHSPSTHTQTHTHTADGWGLTVACAGTATSRWSPTSRRWSTMRSRASQHSRLSRRLWATSLGGPPLARWPGRARRMRWDTTPTGRGGCLCRTSSGEGRTSTPSSS